MAETETLAGVLNWNTYMWPLHVICVYSQDCGWVPKGSILRESQVEIFYSLALEVTWCHFCHIPLVGQSQVPS